MQQASTLTLPSSSPEGPPLRYSDSCLIGTSPVLHSEDNIALTVPCSIHCTHWILIANVQGAQPKQSLSSLPVPQCPAVESHLVTTYLGLASNPTNLSAHAISPYLLTVANTNPMSQDSICTCDQCAQSWRSSLAHFYAGRKGSQDSKNTHSRTPCATL